MAIKLPEIVLKKQDAPASSAAAQSVSATSNTVKSAGSGSSSSSSSTAATPMNTGTPIFMSNINLFDDDEQKEGGDKWSARDTVFCLRNQKALYGESTLNDCYRYEGQTICGVEMVANGERSTIKVWNEDKQEYEEVSGAQAMADSYDSELDLYIEESLEKFIKEECHGDSSYWWDGRGFLTEDKQRLLLEKYGITVSKLDDRTYTFSLVDMTDCPEDMDKLEYARTEAPILEDANGNKGSIIWGDWVIPDGFAQGAELNLSSMLDKMGFDCISQSDFIGHEAEYQQLISDIGTELDNFNNGQGSQFIKSGEVSAAQYIEDLYDGTTIISLASGGGSSKLNDAEFDALVQMAIELGIELDEIYGAEDTAEEAKEKVKKALKEAGVSDEEIAQKEQEVAKATLDKAVNEYQERLDKMSDGEQEVDTDELAQEIADEFGIEVDVLLDEIK